MDQWFGVLARGIRKANFIGSAIALHAIYKIAHAEKVEHLRPKEVHMIEVYHDFRKYYAPLINEDIHHFGIPLRWKLKRDPLLACCTAQYQVVSPTAGLSHLETWQPVASKLANIDNTGTVEMSLFMSYGGPEVLYNALGINTTKHATSVDLLTNIAKTSNKTTSVGDVADVLPLIRTIEARAIAETEGRLNDEANGIFTESVGLTKEQLKMIEAEITATNSSRGGRIVWLRRSKISEDPHYLSRRPDLLPNPDLWFSITQTDAEKRKVLEEDGKRLGVPPPKVKSDPEVALAQSRLIAFQRGATEIATTASLVLKMIPEQIEVDASTTDIRQATSNFRKPVLTKREHDWYINLSTSNRILQRQRALVQAELARPWEIVNIPVESLEQKQWREKMIQERAVISAQLETRLRKIVLRMGEGEYDPTLQVVAMDGFSAASTSDIDKMRRPQLDQLAKGHIPDYKKLKVDALRAALKTFMTANPGVIQLPGEAPSDSPILQDGSGSVAAMATIPAATISSSADLGDDIPDPSTEPACLAPSVACACLECEEVAVIWCDLCQLMFCGDLHGAHTSHILQTLKGGASSAFNWQDYKPSQGAMLQDSLGTNFDVGIDLSEDGESLTTVAPSLSSAPNQPSPKRARITSAFRMPGDNKEKRTALEKEKLKSTLEFIRSLQSTKSANYNDYYQKLQFQNYYDTDFICLLANALSIDVGAVTSKKRYSHKELLNCLIENLIN